MDHSVKSYLNRRTKEELAVILKSLEEHGDDFTASVKEYIRYLLCQKGKNQGNAEIPMEDKK